MERFNDFERALLGLGGMSEARASEITQEMRLQERKMQPLKDEDLTEEERAAVTTAAMATGSGAHAQAADPWPSGTHLGHCDYCTPADKARVLKLEKVPVHKLGKGSKVFSACDKCRNLKKLQGNQAKLGRVQELIARNERKKTRVKMSRSERRALGR